MNPDSNDQEFLENPAFVAEQSDSWLLRAWKGGDEQAAEVLFDRYAIRLVALVAGRLNHRFRSAIDPDEVVQSAMGSFFNAARHSRIEVCTGVSLWRLLATFARRKMARRIEKQSAEKRGGAYQRVPFEKMESHRMLVADNDGQDDASEFLRHLNSELPEELSSVVEGMLAGQTQRELAKSLGIDERTVRRRLVRVRELIAPETATVKPIAHAVHRQSTLPVVNYNEFVLGELIGSGGFGKVYRARMQDDGRTVAAKFLRKAFWQNESARVSFLREIDLASRIKHPGVIRYLGYGESPHGGPYLLSQWIEGRTMSGVATPSPKKFISWLVQICHAIETVHRTGLVHGDLTPSNILIDHNDRITITDFGFSQVTASAGTSILGGTPGFAAPEQIDPCFGGVSPRTDIYAIGGLVCWYLFAEPPNGGSDLVSMLAVTTKLVEGQKSRFEDCPQPFRSILEGTLCPSPADRIQSAERLVSLLA